MNKDIDINFYVLLGYNKIAKRIISKSYKSSRGLSYVIDFMPRMFLTRFRHFKYFSLNITKYDDILEMAINTVLDSICEDEHIVLVPCNEFFYNFIVRNKEQFERLCAVDTDYFISEGKISNDAK